MTACLVVRSFLRVIAAAGRAESSSSCGGRPKRLLRFLRMVMQKLDGVLLLIGINVGSLVLDFNETLLVGRLVPRLLLVVVRGANVEGDAASARDCVLGLGGQLGKKVPPL